MCHELTFVYPSVGQCFIFKCDFSFDNMVYESHSSFDIIVVTFHKVEKWILIIMYSRFRQLLLPLFVCTECIYNNNDNLSICEYYRVGQKYFRLGRFS